jgi:hypothetical protein
MDGALRAIVSGDMASTIMKMVYQLVAAQCQWRDDRIARLDKHLRDGRGDHEMWIADAVEKEMAWEAVVREVENISQAVVALEKAHSMPHSLEVEKRPWPCCECKHVGRTATIMEEWLCHHPYWQDTYLTVGVIHEHTGVTYCPKLGCSPRISWER